MKILQLYYKMPFPVQDGGAFSIYAASRGILKSGHDLRILAMNLLRSPGTPDGMPEDFRKTTRFEAVIVDNRLNPLRAFGDILTKRSFFAGRFYSEVFANRLSEVLKKEQFDVIQLEHLYLCSYLDVIRSYSDAKVVLRAQNVENRIWKEYSRRLSDPFLRTYLSFEIRKLEEFEIRMASKVDGIMAISETDAKYFRLFSSKSIAAIPPAVDLTKDSTTDEDLPFRDFPVVYHLGSMDWRPNRQGLKWFIRKVLPLVQRECSDLRFCLAGRNMPAWFRRKAGSHFEVRGLVPDAAEFQSDKAIMIVPLLSGSGIRIKILEGMALGKTIISTSVGAVDIKAVDGKSIFLADTPEEFAACICRCASSPGLCRSVGKEARKVAETHYSLESISRQMASFYDSLVLMKN